MEKFLDLYYRCLEYDIAVFSQPWLYYWLLVPACCYLAFFMLKWTVLTTPFWLPVVFALRAGHDK